MFHVEHFWEIKARKEIREKGVARYAPTYCLSAIGYCHLPAFKLAIGCLYTPAIPPPSALPEFL
jgi:hypothetical protein